MRKSFDGLFGLVTGTLKSDPLSGDVYVFLNKRKNRIKFLFWDRGGFWIFYKRLEKGTFKQPSALPEGLSSDLSYHEIMMMIEGIELESVKRRLRYHAVNR